MRLATFVDMSYVRSNDLDFQIDFKKLNVIIQEIAEKTLGRQVLMNSVVVVGSIPSNIAEQDKPDVERVQTFYNILKTFPCFEVIVIPIDYHGFRFRKDDRIESINPYELNFIPTEKGVDTTLAVRMLELRHRDHAIDAACILTGDADMIPAIKSLQNSGCAVFVAGLNNQKTLSYQYAEENIRCVDLVEYRNVIERTSDIKPELQKQIDGLLREIELSMEALGNWSNEKLLAQLNLWTSKARLLSDQIGDEKSDSFKIIFGMLSKISRDFQPGYVPGLKRNFQGQWENYIEHYSGIIKSLEQNKNGCSKPVAAA